MDTGNYRRRVLHKLAKDLELWSFRTRDTTPLHPASPSEAGRSFIMH
jgi:hypothetical protein